MGCKIKRDDDWSTSLGQVARANEILNWILRLKQHEIAVTDRAILVGFLDLWIIMVSDWYLAHNAGCAYELAASLPDCCAEKYQAMADLLKDIRLHLERWSITRLHKLRLDRLFVKSRVSKEWNLLVKIKLKAEWRHSVIPFLRCSPGTLLMHFGTAKETQYPKAGVWHGLMMKCFDIQSCGVTLI